ncbi:MAG: putative glycoside hydrolase [Minisyncoccia bacterium]
MLDLFKRNLKIVYLSFVILFILFFLVILPRVLSGHYISYQKVGLADLLSGKTKAEPVFIPSYVVTPSVVKGIYMTSWVAGDKKLRDGLINLLDDTELNTIVIDIKDYSGKIVFPITNRELNSYGSEEVRVNDLEDFIETLHKKDIYVIGRVAVFQDAYFVKYRPDLAVKNESGTEIWKDQKGISWIDAGSREYWDYIILLSKEARKIGFDEINFDYIRFPSDGNMNDISYPWSSTTPKILVLKNFFEYLHNNLIDSGLKTSADLFGMTTTALDDMGIGQVLENTLPYFDYVSPMVYPSHYSADFEGFKEPEAHPYEIVKIAMQSAVLRAKIASTSPDKLRPWLQDFGLKMSYGPTEVRAQINATNDVGLDSWLLWSASNKYTKGALGSK